MKTAIDTIREELEAAIRHSEIAQVDCNEGNIVKELERLDLRIDAALTSLKSLEGRLTVDALANEIRSVDGNNSLGAGALAEALMPFLTKSANP